MLLNKINITIYFENIIVKLHVLYMLNTHVKFCVNQILFTIWSINLYFIHNFKLQIKIGKKFIDTTAIDFEFFRNFSSMKM